MERTQVDFASAAEMFRPGGDWDQLLANSPTDTVFLSSAWMRAAVAVLPEKCPMVVPVLYQNGRLIAAAAFFQSRRVIQFLGTGSSDYLDLLVCRDLSTEEQVQCKRDLLHAVLKRFRGHFHLKNIPENSTTCMAVSGNGLLGTRLRTTPAPAMAMSHAPEALKKKSIRRHFNKLDKQGVLICETMTSATEVLEKLPAFFDQHIARWQGTAWPSQFHQPLQRTLFTRLVQELCEAGTLRFTEVRLDGQMIAAHLGMFHAGIFTWYKPTYDPRLAKLSPGEVLIKALLERAQQEGAEEFDFTIGDEAFKYRFATTVRQVMDFHVTTSKAAALAVRSKLAARRCVRALLVRFKLKADG